MNEMIELLRITIIVLIEDNSCALLVLSSSAAIAEAVELSGDFIVNTLSTKNTVKV